VVIFDFSITRDHGDSSIALVSSNPFSSLGLHWRIKYDTMQQVAVRPGGKEQLFDNMHLEKRGITTPMSWVFTKE
jgi:hypothetical protein